MVSALRSPSSTPSAMKHYLAELVRHRDLLFWLAAKEIKVRYKRPLLGVLWALLVPLVSSLILWFVFTYVLPMPPGQQPFFLFLIVGMFPWNFFAQSLTHSTTSVLDAGALIRKTRFPRALVPLSVVAANLFNFVLALAMVTGLVMAISRRISPELWLLPLAVTLQLSLTIGMALLISSWQVRFRDVKYLTELGLVLWFYLTPVFYSLETIVRIPLLVRRLYLLNPCVGILELYRLALFGQSSVSSSVLWSITAIAGVWAVAILVVGLWIFRRQEPTLADFVTA